MTNAGVPGTAAEGEALERGWRAALAYCRRGEHVRRTIRIALVVGIVLTAINQLDVILRGEATATTWIKCGMNFVVPFIVSNLGLLSGRRSQNSVPGSSGDART
jgi:hypothetical protein